jgi:hypothetical protein
VEAEFLAVAVAFQGGEAVLAVLPVAFQAQVVQAVFHAVAPPQAVAFRLAQAALIP